MNSSSATELTAGLGVFSIALGLTELLATRQLTHALGMRGSESLVQAYGLREIATGIGILTARNPEPWMWGRVAGDALDIVTLMRGFSEDSSKNANVGIALAAVAGVTVLDVLCANALSQSAEQKLAG